MVMNDNGKSRAHGGAAAAKGAPLLIDEEYG